MKRYDKLRILWIDDLPNEGHPKRDLGIYAQYFEVIGTDHDGQFVSIRSVDEYNELLANFIAEKQNDKVNLIFPAEILAVDYDLSKFTPFTDQKGNQNVNLDNVGSDLRKQSEGDNDEETPIKQTTLKESRIDLTQMKNNVNYDDYDGCIIMTMYLSEFRDHPTGAVITTYQDKNRRHRCARILENHLERCYSIVPMFTGQRTWENILHSGVIGLRKRMQEQYLSGSIIISINDLMALAENSGKESVSVQSSHVVRNFSVQGLFIDVPEQSRPEAILAWAKDLLGNFDGFESIKQAKELAENVWRAYNNHELMDDRHRLSLLTLAKERGEKIDEAEYSEKCHKFGVVNNKCKDKDNVIDITCGDYSDRVRRWATLIIVQKLLSRVLRIKKKIENRISEDTMELVNNPEGPVMSVDDIYLALFPLSATPLVFPWDEDSNLDKSSGWVRSLQRFKDTRMIEKNIGDLAMHIPDVLSGADWQETGPHGLFPAERLFLQGLIQDEEGLTSADWKNYRPAQRFLFGVKKE